MAVDVLIEFDVYGAESLLLEFDPEKQGLPILVDDGKFFDRRIIVESTVDIDTVLVHEDLRDFRSIVFYKHIHADKHKNRDTEGIQTHEDPPYDEGERENSGSRIPAWTLGVLFRDIPGKHRGEKKVKVIRRKTKKGKSEEI